MKVYKNQKAAILVISALLASALNFAQPAAPVQAAVTQPLSPALIAPAQSSTVSTLQPRIQWSASEVKSTYTLQVATDPRFSILIVNLSGITVPYYDIPNLKPNTSYYWRVSSKTSSGMSSNWSSIWYFKTLLSLIPNAPGNLAATAVSSTQINLSWQDKSENEIKFKIERKTAGGTYFQIALLSANATSYSDTNLKPDNIYYYRVRAYGTAGDSAYSNEAYAATKSPPPPAPTVISPVNGAIVRTLTPKLMWNASQDLATYRIQVAANYDFSTIIIDYTGIAGPAYQIPSTFLRWEFPYYWRVSVRSPGGTFSDWSLPQYFTVFQEPRSSFSCGCGH